MSSNRFSRRTLLTAAAAVAAGTVLPGCGQDGGDAGGDISKDKVELRFTWWGSDARHKRTQRVIELFTKAHPNITVKGEFKEWVGYWDSLATTVAATDAPDIIQMDELYLASYAERGALLDLGTAAKHLKTADFDPNALATGKIGDKLYGVPTGLNAYCVVANTDLLAQYRIDLPDDATWTWDDYRSVGDKVSKAGGGKVFGIQPFGFDTGGLNVWIRQKGAALYDDKGKVAVAPDVLAGFWQYLLDLVKGGVTPSASKVVEAFSGALDQSAVATNTAVFSTNWSNQFAAVVAASKQNFKQLRLPGEAAGTTGAYYKPSMFLSIFSKSKHPAEAALFADFFVNNPEAADVLQIDRGTPANTRIRDAVVPKLTGADKGAAEYLNTVKVGSSPRVTPNGASDSEAILRRHTEQVLFGKLAPQAAAASFIKELQAAIDAA